MLVEGFIFTKIRKIYKKWLLSVDIKPFGIVNNVDQNVLEVKTVGSKSVCEVNLAAGSTTLKIKAYINDASKTITLQSPYKTLPMDQYSSLKIYHIYDDALGAYIIEVVLNGISLGYNVNTAPRNFPAADIFTNNGPTSKAYIKNLYLLNLV